MYNFDNLLKNRSLFEEFINTISDEYSEELQLISEGYHFCPETLEKTGIPIKYTYDNIMKISGSLGIKWPLESTKSDIVFVVNHLYSYYYPLIPDLSTAIRFSEKYINDPDYPEHDKPYKLYYDKHWKHL